jgi:hypothetical protein
LRVCRICSRSSRGVDGCVLNQLHPAVRILQASRRTRTLTRWAAPPLLATCCMYSYTYRPLSSTGPCRARVRGVGKVLGKHGLHIDSARSDDA